MDEAIGFIYFLAAIGAIWLFVLIIKLLSNIIRIMIPAKDYADRYGVNTWAVVTGGSDGLGLGFCEELANLGFNICMISRNKNKMQ